MGVKQDIEEVEESIKVHTHKQHASNHSQGKAVASAAPQSPQPEGAEGSQQWPTAKSLRPTGHLMQLPPLTSASFLTPSAPRLALRLVFAFR